jgi:two-component system, chemotaxis family, chemotaxis protein CheY
MAVNVLVVDDSAVMRAMILKSLRMSGIDLGATREATNGLEGLEALRDGPFDIVIVDINMPVMTGEEMIDRMKADPAHRELPILIISTEGGRARLERLREMGAAFIHKPFAPEKIRDTIQTMLKTGDRDDGES